MSDKDEREKHPGEGSGRQHPDAQRAIEGGVVFSLAMARGILASRYQRRQVMFFGMLLVMGQAFLGVVVIESFLTERPLLFAVYWLFCFVAVVFVLLLAVYDLLGVRREAREREVALRATMTDSIREAIERRRHDGDGGDDDDAR